MDAGLLAQNVVVAFAVMLSAVYLVRRQWPGAARRARGRAALWLMRDARSPWMRRIGRGIAPSAGATGATDCATPCGGCGPAARH